jgi:DNA-binding MarR family transcriptional regulator
MTAVWLSDDEQRAWRTYLRMSSLLPAALNRQLQQDCGLTLPEYEVLVQLSESPGHRLRPFQICEGLNWEQSRLSHQLTRMERRRLVSRRECAADGRGAVIELTAAGADLIGAAAPRHVATVRGLVFDRLSAAERTAFEEACSRIVAVLTEQGCRGSRDPADGQPGLPRAARPAVASPVPRIGRSRRRPAAWRRLP